MTDPIWTPEQVDNLNRYQKFGMFHNFTCGNEHEGPNSLVATSHGWMCPSCEYRQNWAHDFMLEFTQEKVDELKAQYPTAKFGC